MADTAILEKTWQYDKVIRHMGTYGRITSPEVLDHIEDCVARFDLQEEFMADDIIVYLQEIYGGPAGGPLRWIAFGTVENTLETEFNLGSLIMTGESRRVQVDYEYDLDTYTTTYWRTK